MFNISILFARCFPFLAWGNFLSFCSISPLSFYCLCKGGGHRKITIIIEDPVAGWQCSSTVLHHLTPPHSQFFFPLHADELSSLLCQVLPSAYKMSFGVWRSCVKCFWFVLLRSNWCGEAMNHLFYCYVTFFMHTFLMTYQWFMEVIYKLCINMFISSQQCSWCPERSAGHLEFSQILNSPSVNVNACQAKQVFSCICSVQDVDIEIPLCSVKHDIASLLLK